MLIQVTLCDVLLPYVMQCHAMLCYIMLRYVILYSFMLCHRIYLPNSTNQNQNNYPKDTRLTTTDKISQIIPRKSKKSG